MKKGELIFALDPNDAKECKKVLYLLESLVGILTWVKVGFQAANILGSQGFEKLKSLKYKIFLDFKFHDIPRTVERDVGIYTHRGVDMLNMHASGGFDMMCAARKGADMSASKAGIDTPILLAVTVLTSMNSLDFDKHFASKRGITEQVIYYAKNAKNAGLEGVCASPLEIESIREACGDDFVIVTPGIRPKWANQGDQKRITTPSEAIKRGADYIVVGRPIIEADEPVKAVHDIFNEIENA